MSNIRAFWWDFQVHVSFNSELFLFIPMQLNFWYPDSELHIVRQMEVDFHVSADQSNIVQTLMEKNKIQYK